MPLSDVAVRAVSGPNSRHAALLEDAFHVLIETPGGGVTIKGDARARAGVKRAIDTLAQRAEAGAEVTEADVRASAAAARAGES
ncbi:PhoH family protein, partial [Caulobacter sp. 17J65-9]|nr:PhoH family protein [Caulobacter sp. 17J65-9]